MARPTLKLRPSVKRSGEASRPTVPAELSKIRDVNSAYVGRLTRRPTITLSIRAYAQPA